MKPDYLKFVQWSEPDQLYVGYCPDLFFGGVCHGADEQKVYRELTRIVTAEITESRKRRQPPPKKAAQVMVPATV
jgi:hypothetical protein